MFLHFRRGPSRAAIFVPLLCLGLCLGAADLRAQSGADYQPINGTPESYVAGPMPRHCLQTYRLFLPRPPHVKPPEGWPVVLDVRLNGFARSEDTPVLLSTTLQARMLDAGIAVITARVTPSILTSDSKYIQWCGAAPDIPGHGLFHPPGYVPQDLAAAGISPYEQREYHMAEKDCVMLIQHVRYKARQTGNFVEHMDAAMSQLDHRRIGVYGSSASAIALMWAAMGPERNAELPFAGLPGQYAESSRPDLAVLSRGAVWWPVFSDQMSVPVGHFGSGGHSELPANVLSDADPLELALASAFQYEDAQAVGTMPLYLSYDEVSRSEGYDKSTVGCGALPLCFQDQGQEGIVPSGSDITGFHPAWSGYAWTNEHPTDPIRLVIKDQAAFDQRQGVPAVPLFGDPLTQTTTEIQEMQDDDLIGWLLAQFDALGNAAPQDEWWSLGNGLAGVAGVPELRAEGTALPGSSVSLALTGARPDAPLGTVIGVSNWSIPMLGGVLVPSPDHGFFGLNHSDATGKLQVAITWPVGISPGTALYFQVWVEDPAAPMGFSATNALELFTP